MSLAAPVPAAVPSAARRTGTVLVARFGSPMISTRSPEASSRTSPFMNGLASTRAIWVSAAATAAASVATRGRNVRLTIVKVVEPTGTRGVRVTIGQRLTNQFDVTT